MRYAAFSCLDWFDLLAPALCAAAFPHVYRKGRWQTALSLLEEIPSRGLALNAHVYGSAVHACVVGGEPSRALALVEEMMESGAVPDAAAFTAAMTAVDGWAAALRLLEVMKREVSDGRSLDAVVRHRPTSRGKKLEAKPGITEDYNTLLLAPTVCDVVLCCPPVLLTACIFRIVRRALTGAVALWKRLS